MIWSWDGRILAWNTIAVSVNGIRCIVGKEDFHAIWNWECRVGVAVDVPCPFDIVA